MPLEKCGKNGWRWGKSGQCYVGKDCKKKAIRQGMAIEGPAKAGKMLKSEDDRLVFDEVFKEEAGEILVESVMKNFLIEDDQDYQIEVAKADEEQRLIYGVVIEPMTDVTKDGDAHGDSMTEEEITKSAHNYMREHQVMKMQHQGEPIDAYPVESYIAPVDFNLGEQEIKKGSWVLVTKVESDLMWKAVKKGLFTGYSPGGTGYRKPLNDED